MEVAIGVFLHKDAARGGEGSICHNKEGFVVIRKGKDRLFEKCVLYFCKGNLLVHGPLPLGILMSEEKEGFC